MSIYQINKILYLTDNDADFRKRITEDPEGALNTFRLSEEGRDALTSGAVENCIGWGFTPFCSITYLDMSFGVNINNYLSRIREGMEYDERFEQGGCRFNISSRKNDTSRGPRAETHRPPDAP